jgi:hypothetical protein
MAVKAHYKLIQNNSTSIGNDLIKATQSGGKPILMTTQLSQGNIIIVFIMIEYSQEQT